MNPCGLLSTISRHILKVLESGELQRNSVVAENETTAADGKTYTVSYYNLDMITSVGFRVNSHRGVQFRQWVTLVLKEYMIKGFALNDDLLKNAGHGITSMSCLREFAIYAVQRRCSTVRFLKHTP